MYIASRDWLINYNKYVNIIRNISLFTIFWHRAQMCFICIAIHCTTIEKNQLCIYMYAIWSADDKKMSTLDKKIHNCVTLWSNVNIIRKISIISYFGTEPKSVVPVSTPQCTMYLFTGPKLKRICQGIYALW